MACAASTTPIWHPTIKDTYSRLVPAPITAKPSEQGYTLGFPGTREVATQEQWVRLFYARYFDVTPTELAITFGTSPLPSVGTEQHKTIRNSLNQIWRGLRSRAFGPKSNVSQLVQHKVEEFDFRVTVTRFMRLEIVFNRVPVGVETPQARLLRLRKAAMNKRLGNEHISRMDNSKSDAVNEATRKLSTARSGSHTTAKHARIREAKKIIEFREREESEWKMDLDNIKSNTTAQDGDPIQNTYATMTQDCQHAFWEDVWSKDVAVAMLSGLMNVIDIQSTLEHSEEIYQVAFMAYAIDSWQYCIGVEYTNRFLNDSLRAVGIEGGIVEMVGEAKRPQVYANMSGTIRATFEDAPGKELDRLRVSIVEPDSPTEGSSKRKLDPEPTFIPKFNFLAKKRRT
jgi:hypothetical protein